MYYLSSLVVRIAVWCVRLVSPAPLDTGYIWSVAYHHAIDSGLTVERACLWAERRVILAEREAGHA